MHKAIPTADVLNAHHVPGNFPCPFCDEVQENFNHLFIECQFAKAFWFGSQLALRVEDMGIVSVTDWIKSFCREALCAKDQRMSLITWILAGCDIIWQVRNNCVWKGARADPNSAIQRLAAVIRNYNEALINPHNQIPKGNNEDNITRNSRIIPVMSDHGLQGFNGIVFSWMKKRKWTLFTAATLINGEATIWKLRKRERKGPRTVELLIFIRDVLLSLQGTDHGHQFTAPSKHIVSILNYGGGSAVEASVCRDIISFTSSTSRSWFWYAGNQFVEEVWNDVSCGFFSGEGMYSISFL